MTTLSQPDGAPVGVAADFPPTIRTPDQRLRVFISSTLGELASERAAARDAITQLHLTPVLFESGARPHPPRAVYRSYLDQSDIFVGIYWQRYGVVAPGMDVSGLEDEYRLAGGKPRLIYLKTPAQEREKRLEALLNRIKVEDVVSYHHFGRPEELSDLIANDLALLLTEHFVEPTTAPTIVQPVPLPAPREALIDRTHELSLLHDLLQRSDVGLVTLTGPGGTGKTRLAIQAATDSAASFADGVAFVSLASLAQGSLIAGTVAQALGVQARGSRSVEQALLDYIRNKELLVVLDNVEHLVGAAPLVMQAIETAARLKLLITSREPLRVRGERVVPVPPLEVPGPDHLPDLESVARVPAVALFLERARQARPDFALTPQNARVIAEICRRLDGLPLAIELAVARLNVLGPQALLARLDRRLPLLTHGLADLPDRQQTLRNTIAWSFELLKAVEQRLFRRVAVFDGGFTLLAFESVCVPEAEEETSEAPKSDPLEVLQALVDKSLVLPGVLSGEETRFSLLDTIREFALEKLDESGEAATVQERHAQFFTQLVEPSESAHVRADPREWAERLDHEYGNLHAALTWSVSDRGAPQLGLRLASAIAWYWFMRGRLVEGRTWLDDLLGKPENSARSAIRGKALCGVGLLTWAQDDLAAASERLEEALVIFQALDDGWWLAHTQGLLGLVRASQGDIAAGRPLLDRGRARFHELGDRRSEAYALVALGRVLAATGDNDGARTFYEQGLALFRQTGDATGVAATLSALGRAAAARGDLTGALALFAESLPLLHASGDQYNLSALLNAAGSAWLQKGDVEQAERLFREGLQIWPTTGSRDGLALGLAGLGSVASMRGQAERAGRLLGAADTLFQPTSRFLRREEERWLDESVATARKVLDPSAFEAGWTAGHAMTEEEALSEAFDENTLETANVPTGSRLNRWTNPTFGESPQPQP